MDITLAVNDAIFIFTDLDDTLFQTARKCPPTDLRTAAWDRQGEPLSFFTPEQQRLLAWLEQGTLIPVTGRNSVALARVDLAFPSYRVTSHGALIVGADGTPDAEWWAQVQPRARDWLPRLEAIVDELGRTLGDAARALRWRVIEDQGLPVYVSIKGDERALADVAKSLAERWSGPGRRLHHNGQNLALLPPYASKEAAVAFLIQRLSATLPAPLFIGMGDSHTDLPFLRLCHYAVTPRHSQIQQNWP